ncbi:MAG: hypothetical protein WC378_00955 [Opitutaceae bacterium]|jgi:hypothetical protein
MALKIFAAASQLAQLTTLLSTAGISVEELLAANDPNALKTSIEGIAGKQIEALQAQLTTATTEHAATKALLEAANSKATTAEAFSTALISAASAAKIKITAETKPEDFAKAFSDAISVKACDHLAKHGLAEFPESEITNDPTKPAALNLAGLDAVAASYRTKLGIN